MRSTSDFRIRVLLMLKCVDRFYNFKIKFHRIRQFTCKTMCGLNQWMKSRAKQIQGLDMHCILAQPACLNSLKQSCSHHFTHSISQYPHRIDLVDAFAFRAFKILIECKFKRPHSILRAWAVLPNKRFSIIQSRF